MKPKDIIFVHGVQWEKDIQIKGYSRPMQQLIQMQSPKSKFIFHEALWSDVIENKERLIISGGKTLQDIISGDLLESVILFLDALGDFVDIDILKNNDQVATSSLEGMLDDPGWLGKAISVTLDVILYFSLYGKEIRSKVREYINLSENPVLMGHSLGSVILFDILNEDINKGCLSCHNLLTAATPLGLFKPNKDIVDLKEINWVNMYDPTDLVGFWNPLNNWGYTSPWETKIKTHELPFYSHIKYWTNSTIADELLDMSLTA